MSELRAIRETVFMKEQNVPKDEEWDGQDEASWHYLAKADGKEKTLSKKSNLMAYFDKPFSIV